MSAYIPLAPHSPVLDWEHRALAFCYLPTILGEKAHEQGENSLLASDQGVPALDAIDKYEQVQPDLQSQRSETYHAIADVSRKAGEEEAASLFELAQTLYSQCAPDTAKFEYASQKSMCVETQKLALRVHELAVEQQKADAQTLPASVQNALDRFAADATLESYHALVEASFVEGNDVAANAFLMSEALIQRWYAACQPAEDVGDEDAGVQGDAVNDPSDGATVSYGVMRD